MQKQEFFNWYKKYLSSKEWASKKNDYINFLLNENMPIECERCNSKEELEVHHLNYDNVGNEEVDKDLCFLCNKCHKEWTEIERNLSPEDKAVNKQDIMFRFMFGENWVAELVEEITQKRKQKKSDSKRRNGNKITISSGLMNYLKNWGYECKRNENYNWTMSDQKHFDSLDLIMLALNHNSYICKKMKIKKDINN